MTTSHRNPWDFMKPGDNPEVDGVLHDLRTNDELYRPGEYDAFGNRRNVERVARRAGAAAGGVGVRVVMPSASRKRERAWVGLLAVIAVLAPVGVFALVVRRGPAVREGIVVAPAEPTRAAIATAVAVPLVEQSPAAPASAAVSPAPRSAAAMQKPHASLRRPTEIDDPYSDVTAASAPPPIPPAAEATAPEPTPFQTRIKF